MAAHVAAAHATLARNLLSSVLALAFPDNLVSDAAAQRAFVAQLPQLRALLSQHNVFDFVADGKGYDKLQTRLFELIDTAHNVDKAVKAGAFELLLVVVEQCSLEALEAILPKLTDRILKMVKYIKDAPRVVASASDVARVLVHHGELYAPEVRRDLHEWIAKLLPANISVLNDLVAKAEPLTKEEVAMFNSVIGVFNELLEVSPSAVRSSLNKLEAAVAALALYNTAIAGDADAALAAARCLGNIASASDKSPQLWKQIVDKAVEIAHQLVDPVGGKRAVSAQQPTGLKVWLRENGGSNAATDLETLEVYQRIEALLQRLNVVVLVLEESLKNRSVSEREVQLVINDVVALTRRIVTVRAHEVGKQSALSEDGFRLPTSVVYGALPQIHAQGLRCLNAVVARAGICALRHASKIAKVLVLASENFHANSHSDLFDSVAVCVRVLGASTLEKIGQPLLEHIVAQCKQDLLDDDKNKKNEAEDAKTVANDGKGKSGKGKKRKRQIGDLSQLAADSSASGALFISTHNQRVLVHNVDAALSAIATCVAVYGTLLSADIRSYVNEVSLPAIAQQSKRRASSVTPTPGGGIDSVAMMLLANTITPDTNGSHATSLVKSVDYWSSPRCPSSLLQLVALNVGEALVHPRGPPLSLNFDNAIKALAAPAPGVNSNGVGRNHNRTTVPAAAAVRGNLDWDRDVEVHPSAEHEDNNDVSEAPTSKRIKPDDEEGVEVEDEPMVEASVVEEDARADGHAEQEEEEEEEDYDDERPVPGAVEEDAASDKSDSPTESAKQNGSAAANVSNDDEDDGDDEFPDIVVDDEDDE